MGMTIGMAREILNRLLEEGTLEVDCPTENDAIALRHRCYRVRQDEKIKNSKHFDATDPMYGRTPWDNIDISIQGSTLILRLDADLSTLRIRNPTTGKEIT